MSGKSGIVHLLLITTILSSSFFIFFSSAAEDPSIILHYTFNDDEYSDIMVEDSSGNDHNGRLRGNARVVDDSIFAKGVEFDGDDSYIEVEHDLECDDSFTIEMWILPESGLKLQYLALIDDGYAADGIYHRILLGDNIENNNGRLLTQFGGDFFSDRTVTWNQWNHIIYMYDDDGDLESYFINGAQAGVKRRSGGAGWSADSFTIGRQRYENRYRFGGMMDEIRILNRVLSETEINDRFQLGVNRLYTGDLSISPVISSDYHPFEGDRIDLHAVVYNNGYGSTEDLMVRFRYEEEKIGDNIFIDHLRARDREIISTVWTAVEGTCNIYAEIVGEEGIHGACVIQTFPSDHPVNGPIVRMTLSDQVIEGNTDSDSIVTARFEVNFSADFTNTDGNDTITVWVDDMSDEWNIDVPGDRTIDEENPWMIMECWLHIPTETSSFTVPFVLIHGNWKMNGSSVLQKLESLLIVDINQYFWIETDTATFWYNIVAGETISIPVEISNLGNGYDLITIEYADVIPDRGDDIEAGTGGNYYGLDSGEQTTANILISIPDNAEEDILFITFSIKSTRVSDSGDPIEIETITLMVDVTVEEDSMLIMIVIIVTVLIVVIIVTIIMFLSISFKPKVQEESESFSRPGHTHIRAGSDAGLNQVQEVVPKPGMAPRPPPG